MKNFFKRMMGGKKKGFVFTTKNLAVGTGNGDRIADGYNGSSGIQFFSTSDFIPSNYATTTNAGYIAPLAVTEPQDAPKTKVVDERKEVEPKAVFEEVKREDIEINFTNLPAKIASVKERLRVLKEHLSEGHLVDEHKTLFFLQNRQKYLSTMKKNPLDWAMTNRDAVNDLCKRYKLQVVPLKQYYTLVPKEGIKEMERYTKAYKAITGDTPIFELVIKEKEAKPEEEKARTRKDRDPILLANSPLGNALYVIGAWDEEVEYIDEIIYNGK